MTLLAERGTTAEDVIVAGSFAGALSFAFVFARGARAVIAHAAGPGKDSAGVSGLAVADRHGLPAAAVRTMSARIGDGASVLEDGIIGYVNAGALALGVREGMRARDAAALLALAPPGRALPGPGRIDRSQRVVAATAAGRIVLLHSTSFADPSNASDVLCAGSHGGRVNAPPLVKLRPRGAIMNDGGMARDGSGASGLALLDAAGVPGVTVAAESARIGDPASVWETGLVSALNDRARAAGVAIGQPACDAARLMLGGT